MPPRNPDLHGNAPDSSCVALVLVDVISDLEFEDGDRLLPHALTGDRCVLFSASDAFMRDLRLWVPTDCVASIDPEHNRRALDEMARLFDADLTDSTRLVLSRSAIKRRARAGAARLRSARAPAARPARRSHAPAA